MARARRRSLRSIDVWPGYVDALTTLLLTITFLLTVYVLAQFFLSQALSGREKALARLSQEIAALSAQLSGERALKQTLETSLATASAARAAAEAQARSLQQELDRLTGVAAAATATRDDLTAQLADEQRSSAAARADVDRLAAQIAELRAQLGTIAAALDASEAKGRADQVVITDLGKRLEAALAEKVAELARYRSEFFGRLRAVVGERPEVRVVGDRFVFQSEVLFPSGSADLTPAGRQTLATFAQTLLEIAKGIPGDVPWVLRVDGHTDRVPIASARYPSNWELSTARALSVVKYLVSRGVPATRLAATGFGEFQPIDSGEGETANARNRRIEMRLTDR